MDQSSNKQKANDPESKNKCLIKPLTVNNALYYYSPIFGTASYTLLSLHVLNPPLRFNFCPKQDFSNVLLVTSLFGTGCYIYSRPHLKLAPNSSRYGFSIFGSVLFSFGSVLLWAILRSILPGNLAICSAAGIASSYVLVQGATNYLEFVDSTVAK